MRKIAPLLFLGLLSLSLAGCGIFNSDNNTGSNRQIAPTNPNYSKSVFIDELRLEIATLKRSFPTTEIVPLRVSVTNTGDKQTNLTYPSGQKYDFTVTDASGAEVWRWSAGRSFTQEVIVVKIKPAENYNFFGRVDAGFLKPGEYTATAWITAEELAGEKMSLKFKVFGAS
ncbi:MAG: BsuPI-related putative proteinase inhibitor [Actinomycetota bacterium]